MPYPKGLEIIGEIYDMKPGHRRNRQLKRYMIGNGMQYKSLYTEEVVGRAFNWYDEHLPESIFLCELAIAAFRTDDSEIVMHVFSYLEKVANLDTEKLIAGMLALCSDEYGVFSFPETSPTPEATERSTEGVLEPVDRSNYEFYTNDNRPTIGGGNLPVRRMYLSVGYISIARRIGVGMIETVKGLDGKTKKRLWLTHDELLLVRENRGRK